MFLLVQSVFLATLTDALIVRLMQAIVEVKKTKTWDLAQVQKYMELLNLHKKVNFGMIISFPGRDPPRWGRLRFHEGQYNPFDLARSDEVVLKHAELLKAHYKAYPAVKP